MHYFFIFFLTFLCFGCSSLPKEYLSNDDICHYNDPIFRVSENELVLKPNIIEQLKKEEGSLIVIDNDEFKNEFYNLSKNKIVNYKTNKKLGIGKWLVYTKEGNIKNCQFIYLNGTKKIKEEIHYDEKGNITKVIDYEKGYNICWAEAIEIVKNVAKKEIEKYDITGFNLSHNNLNKFPEAKPEWQITLDGNEEYERKPIKVYRIDGATGKFLKITKIFITPN